jgi:hypothetical protein
VRALEARTEMDFLLVDVPQKATYAVPLWHPMKKSFLKQILQNASATPQQATAKAELEARTCAQCGAARASGSDLSTCEFCGGAFFGASSPQSLNCPSCGAAVAESRPACEFCGARLVEP